MQENKFINNHIFMPEDHMENLYASRNPLVKFIHLNRLRQIARMIGGNSNLKILDAGCGEGHLINKLHKKNNNNLFYGVDITKIA